MSDLTEKLFNEKTAILKSLNFQFGKLQLIEKYILLQYFIQNTSNKPWHCVELHKVLLSMLAYPENKKIHNLTQLAQLALVEHIVRNTRLRNSLSGSGIYTTISTECNFSYAKAKYLTTKFPGSIFIHSSAASSETIKAILKILLPAIEYADIHEGDLDLLSRIALFKKNNSLTNLEWLLRLIDHNIAEEKNREIIYHQFEVYLCGKISNRDESVTFLRGLSLPLHFNKKPIQKRIISGKIIKKKLPKPVELTLKERLKIIDAAKLTLFYLNSETEPFSNANENDITFFLLEKGISIALFGSKTEKRYSLESYIGYLVFKNNIPVAYGGGWLFGNRCQFGINILEAFRGGESNLIFCQLLRVYHQYYNATTFVVKPYQFGLNNPEGLKAGAFWFYYNSGFRPEKQNILEIAWNEEKKKKKESSYRSDLKILKKFTQSNLKLNVKDHQNPDYDAVELSKKITCHINEKYNGNRGTALHDCFNILKSSLQIKTANWKKEEIDYARNVSLLFCMKPGSEEWIRKNRKNILAFILLKTAKTERPWILNLQKFKSFWERMNN